MGKLRLIRRLLVALTVSWLGGSTVWRCQAQPSMQTILTNGPASNRLNIVILSEGYTSNQLSQFLVDATNAVNALLAHQPYQEYRSFFNAFAIKVASNQSGSDHGSDTNYYHDTYFNSLYEPPDDFIISIPPNSRDTNYSHGQAKVDALLQTFMPKCHLPILLVNDAVPGGSDGFDKTAIASVGSGSFEILTHETGHVLANLGDEYSSAYPGFPDTEEPNTTRQTNLSAIKWRAWIPTNTPLPTPATEQYSAVVGLFEGAHYHVTNWFRPQLNCAMGNFSSPFCQVCSEALVLAIYQKVRPVDGFTPAATNLSVSSSQPLSFTLGLLAPAHSLTVQWRTNGAAIIGATNLSLALLPDTLGNGTQIVSAVVNDNTSLVRNDPTNLLSQTVSWTLNVNIPQLRLDSVQALAGGQFAFRISGNAPQGFVVQSSTNFFNWTNLQTNFLLGGEYRYTNSGAASFPRKFFRAVTPP